MAGCEQDGLDGLVLSELWTEETDSRLNLVAAEGLRASMVLKRNPTSAMPASCSILSMNWCSKISCIDTFSA